MSILFRNERRSADVSVESFDLFSKSYGQFHKHIRQTAKNAIAKRSYLKINWYLYMMISAKNRLSVIADVKDC